MKNAFLKFLLWCIAMIAVSAVTIFVLYKLAYFIAIMLALLVVGAIVGIPLTLIIRSKWKSAMFELENEVRHKSKLEEEFYAQFGGKK